MSLTIRRELDRVGQTSATELPARTFENTMSDMNTIILRAFAQMKAEFDRRFREINNNR